MMSDRAQAIVHILEDIEAVDEIIADLTKKKRYALVGLLNLKVRDELKREYRQWSGVEYQEEGNPRDQVATQGSC
jgi:hypothetical protein